MDYNGLKGLVEQMVTEAPKDPVKAAENAIIYYFKELAGAEGDTDYQEARRFAADFNTVMQRAPNSDRTDFNNAWNNLVDANKLWYHKEDGKGIYTFASNQKEIEKLQTKLAPEDIPLQKPSKDAPEKIASTQKSAPKQTSSSTDPVIVAMEKQSCANETTGVKFEWAIIAAALQKAGVDPDNLPQGKSSAYCGYLWGEQGSNESNEKARKRARAKGTDFSGKLMKAEAESAIRAVIESGLIADVNEAFEFADTVGSTGVSGDPKTDITFGKESESGEGFYKVSVKMAGGIQLESPEGKGFKQTLDAALKVFMTEAQGKELLTDASHQSAKKSAQEAGEAITPELQKLKKQVDSATDKMIEQGYKEGEEDEKLEPHYYIPGSSSDREIENDYKFWAAQATEEGAKAHTQEFATLKGKARAPYRKKMKEAEKKLKDFKETYKSYFDEDFDGNFTNLAARLAAAKSAVGAGDTGATGVAKIEHMFEKTKAGVITGVKKAYDWDKWNENAKDNLVDAITSLLNDNQRFKFLIVEEALSGRRKYSDHPLAVADYMLTPTKFVSLKPPEEGEDDTKYRAMIQQYVDNVVVDARGKGRGAGKKSISYRLDIDPDKIATKSVEEASAGETAALEEQLNEGFFSWAKEKISKGIEGAKAAWNKFTDWIGGFFAKFKDIFTKNVEEKLIEAVDVDDLAAKIAKNPSEFFDLAANTGTLKEHLTKTPLSYTMLREMIENLMSEE